VFDCSTSTIRAAIIIKPSSEPAEGSRKTNYQASVN
jgi:hypothetical protein